MHFVKLINFRVGKKLIIMNNKNSKLFEKLEDKRLSKMTVFKGGLSSPSCSGTCESPDMEDVVDGTKWATSAADDTGCLGGLECDATPASSGVGGGIIIGTVKTVTASKLR